MDWRLTLISSGASSVASLVLTGATSSIVMDGKLDTTLTSGTGYGQKQTWIQNESETFYLSQYSTV